MEDRGFKQNPGNKDKFTGVKLLLVILTLLLTGINSFAQYYYGPPPPPRKPQQAPGQQNQDIGPDKPTGFLSVDLGLVNPEGAFALQTGSGYGGYALPGYQINFSMGLLVNHSNFGVAIQVGSITNTYNNDQWVSNLLNDPNSYFYGNAQSVQGTVNFYSSTSILVGLYGTLPMGRLSIDGRLMAGALIAGLPERAFQFTYNTDTLIEDDVQPANPISLAFDAGIGLRYLIANFGRRKVCLMVNADYLFSNVSYTTPDYQYLITASNPYYPAQINTQALPQISPVPDINGNISGTIPIALFSVTVGLGYQF